MDPGLRPEHALDGLKEVKRGPIGVWEVLTSTQAPQVMPSIRNSQLSIFPRELSSGSFSTSGSSTLPGPEARVSLYQRLEKVDETADILL